MSLVLASLAPIHSQLMRVAGNGLHALHTVHAVDTNIEMLRQPLQGAKRHTERYLRKEASNPAKQLRAKAAIRKPIIMLMATIMMPMPMPMMRMTTMQTDDDDDDVDDDGMIIR